MVRASFRMRWKAWALMPGCDMAARSRLLLELSSRQYSLFNTLDELHVHSKPVVY